MAKDSAASAAAAQQESAFLAALEARPIPVDTLIEEVRALQAAGQSSAAANNLQLMEDALVEANDRDGLLRLLRFRAAGHENDRAFSLFCRELLSETWKDREAAAFLESAGFNDHSPAEALRRLDLLLNCKAGAMFLDKTWGFGVVKRIDNFYRKITIDFTRKPGHQLTFAYAAEALTPIDATHLLALSHTNPAAIARLVAEQSDEIVRMTLRSFGALSAVRLEQLLTEHRIVADWKPFWERARKGLKSDPLVEMPAKRSEPIILHAQTRDYGPSWVSQFARERDPAKILTGVETFCEATEGAFDEAARPVLIDRLAFATKGALNTDPALYARLAALMDRTRIEAVPPAEMRAHLWEQNRFLKAAEHLTARDAERMVKVLLADAEAPARTAVFRQGAASPCGLDLPPPRNPGRLAPAGAHGAAGARHPPDRGPPDRRRSAHAEPHATAVRKRQVVCHGTAGTGHQRPPRALRPPAGLHRLGPDHAALPDGADDQVRSIPDRAPPRLDR